MSNKSIELKKYTLADIGRAPEYFDTEVDGHGKLSLVDTYGVLFPNGENQRPIWFIRHCNPDAVRFAGIHRPGDGHLSLQTPLHLDDLAQKGTPIVGYNKVDDTCYGISAEEPFFEYRFYEDYLTYKEADVLNLRAEPFPAAIFKHADESTTTSQITQPCLYSGTYEGKPVTGIGNFELVYVPEKQNNSFNFFFSYIYAYDVGVRPDGKKEVAMTHFSLDGKSTGLYWLEGEDTVISHDVKLETVWEPLPYMEDGTCTYKDAVWRFGGKEIHFTGKWGAKGITAYPRVELGGQSQVLGTWYEGSTPYEHKLSMTFHENMNVYADKLKAGGFKVKEII